ncbi:MAG: YihA family ribosome biogenesis GTP-binding protein [Methylocapsa sp.]|nr:YihA family ribosome biogenesis GTP-binding protein [Methylocapsa sp.]
MGNAPGDSFEFGSKLFAREWAFVAAAAAAERLPEAFAPEIAFAGRSNVGKSSLLNALTGRKSLARISRAPGRTRELHFFAPAGDRDAAGLCLIDLPGYGHAAASKDLAAAWARLTRDFLRGRAALMRVLLLIDGRHGARPIDTEMMNFFDRAAVSYQIVLTKKDEVKTTEQEARLAAAHALAACHPAAFPNAIFTSARTGEGIGELRAAIARLIPERSGGSKEQYHPPG